MTLLIIDDWQIDFNHFCSQKISLNEQQSGQGEAYHEKYIH
jgi:hypothetical protein